MINLNSFIIERLKISKDSKIKSINNYLVYANNMDWYNNFHDKYHDNYTNIIIGDDRQFEFFIVPRSEIIDITKNLKDKESKVWELPNDFKFTEQEIKKINDNVYLYKILDYFDKNFKIFYENNK